MSVIPLDYGIAFCINLELGTHPNCIPSYRMALAELRELKAPLQDLLSKGFIRSSASPWGTPMLFVKNKNDSLCMCIEYMQLNKLVIHNKYPFPHIDALFYHLQGTFIFFKIDLRFGYHQLKIWPNNIPKTAF